MTSVSIDVIGAFWRAMKRELYGFVWIVKVTKMKFLPCRLFENDYTRIFGIVKPSKIPSISIYRILIWRWLSAAHHVELDFSIQWQIQDFPDGAPTLEFEVKTDYLARLLPKTEWKMKEIERGCVTLPPPEICQWYQQEYNTTNKKRIIKLSWFSDIWNSLQILWLYFLKDSAHQRKAQRGEVQIYRRL